MLHMEVEGHPVVVRRAKGRDATAILGLYAQLVSNPGLSVLPQAVDAIADKPGTALLVCEVGGQICGTALVCLCDDVMFNTQPFAIVENVVVDANMRGQGVGRALFRCVEDFCSKNRCTKIMLLSSSQRTDAHQFFERCGYTGNVKRGFVKYSRDFAARV